MNRTYLVVFEKGTESWGAFAPDISGTGGLGDTMEEARESLREGIGYVFEHAIEKGLPIPEALATSVDFSELNPDHAQSHYVVEWLNVEVPEIVHENPPFGLIGAA